MYTWSVKSISNEIEVSNLVSIQVLSAEDINIKKADKILKKLTV